MSNMSYCRFENTLRDLKDCHHALQDCRDEEMNSSEIKARQRLISLCRDIAEEFDY